MWHACVCAAAARRVQGRAREREGWLALRQCLVHAPPNNLAVNHQDSAHRDAALEHALARLHTSVQRGARQDQLEGTQQHVSHRAAQPRTAAAPGPSAQSDPPSAAWRTSLMASSRNFRSSDVGSGTDALFPCGSLASRARHDETRRVQTHHRDGLRGDALCLRRRGHLRMHLHLWSLLLLRSSAQHCRWCAKCAWSARGLPP